MAIPILIDTDIGSDIDDAFAIALALQSPEVEIKGVTTVFCNTDRRTALAEMLLKLAEGGISPCTRGCRIPSFKGKCSIGPLILTTAFPNG